MPTCKYKKGFPTLFNATGDFQLLVWVSLNSNSESSRKRGSVKHLQLQLPDMVTEHTDCIYEGFCLQSMVSVCCIMLPRVIIGMTVSHL